jgi:hypothetical protein
MDDTDVAGLGEAALGGLDAKAVPKEDLLWPGSCNSLPAGNMKRRSPSHLVMGLVSVTGAASPAEDMVEAIVLYVGWFSDEASVLVLSNQARGYALVQREPNGICHVEKTSTPCAATYLDWCPAFQFKEIKDGYGCVTVFCKRG